MANTQFNSKSIVLLGDLASHMVMVRERSEGNAINIHEAPYRGYQRLASKPLLSSMIINALRDGEQVNDNDDCVVPNYEQACSSDKSLNDTCKQLISVLDIYPEGSNSKRDSRSTLRVKFEYPLTLDSPEGGNQTYTETWINLLNHVVKRHVYPSRSNTQNAADPSVLVLYDQNGFMRTAIKSWKAEGWKNDLGDFKQIVKRVSDDNGGIIVGINGDLSDITWINTLAELLKEGREKLIVQITADSLRKAGLNITKYGALEESIKDIWRCRKNSPLKELLELTDRLLIVFRETGGLYIEKLNNTWNASLHFCPNFDRIAQSDATSFGEVPGKFAIFLVALVKEIYRADNSQPGRERKWNIPDAIGLGTVAYNHLFTMGLNGNGKDPFSALENALAPEICEKLHNFEKRKDKRDYLVSSVSFEFPNDDDFTNWDKNWSRTLKLEKGEGEEIFALEKKCLRIVEDGLEAALYLQPNSKDDHRKPWFPSNHIEIPYTTFKKIKLIDHNEIKNHYSLAKVIRKYIETNDWATPLSIAVFGRPGSGKSFGVKQILEAVDPGRKSVPLTFNLAQFGSVDQLTDAFHQIQDKALSSDEVPLAIFDEFDAQFDKQQFGWLKYFLAPMQDGLFRGKTGEYKVGRAIFLFSGGTSYSYKEFSKKLQIYNNNNNNSKENKEKNSSNHIDTNGRTICEFGAVSNAQVDLEIRSSKLADFTSRLRGYLDIMDINEYDDKEILIKPLPLTRLRRAIILRSLLEEYAKAIFVSYASGDKHARINHRVVTAFLDQEKYVHGVRSMEAIIQMSRWIDGQFVAASLPSEGQLVMHAPDFLKN